VKGRELNCHVVCRCPFNTWRNSYDEAGTLYDTALFLLNMNARNTAKISRPGCWAMAGMLMMGVDSTHARWLKNSPAMNYTESRAQFGGECILSSPLILSFDPSNATAIDSVWNIITNREAIAVNKAWAGQPGALLDQSGSEVGMWCFQFDRLQNTTCKFAKWMVWSKPLPYGVVAVLLMNNDNQVSDVNVSIEALNITCGGHHDSDNSQNQTCYVRDIWKKRDLGAFPTSGVWTAKQLTPHDTMFIVVTPTRNTSAWRL
jgi:hypothetical protein